MAEGLWSRPGAKRVHQTLPRHMRRRAMSHNAKRLPVRLRQAAERDIIETGSHTTSEKRKRSRRHRRRPGNIAEEYESRSEACTWLETHIWHAKRMHIVDMWGWRLPRTPCDKSARATHRATSTDCTIRDRSYNGCIEISAMLGGSGGGGEAEAAGRLVAFLSKFMQHMEAVPQASNVEHTRGFYATRTAAAGGAGGGGGGGGAAAADRGGECFVGTVAVMWRCAGIGGGGAAGGGGSAVANGPGATVWVWVHASSYDSILSILMQAAVDGDGDGDEGGAIGVTGRKNQLVRFELTGPTCHAVLQSVLTPAQGAAGAAAGTDAPGDGAATVAATTAVATAADAAAAAAAQQQQQAQLWRALLPLGSAASLSPSVMLGLTVTDPRLLSPSQTKPRTGPAARAARNAAHHNDPADLTKLMVEWPADAARSAVWSEDVRASLLAAQQSTKDINVRREALLIPGDSLPVQDNDAQIPILLVQRPGVARAAAPTAGSGGSTADRGCTLGYGGGWDLVVPSGWAMAFWLPLVLAGARAIGIDEYRATALEMGVLTEPYDNPDTMSHADHAATTAADAEAFHARRPVEIDKFPLRNRESAREH